MLAPPSLAESEILVVNWEWINLVVKLVVAIFLWILDLMALIFWFFEVFDPFRGGRRALSFQGQTWRSLWKNVRGRRLHRERFSGGFLLENMGVTIFGDLPPNHKIMGTWSSLNSVSLIFKTRIDFQPFKTALFQCENCYENPHDQVGDLPDLRVVRRVKEILCVSRTLWMWILYICYANTYTHYSNSHNIYIYSYMVFIYNYSYMVFI